MAYAPLTAPALRLDTANLKSMLDEADSSRENLFAFPAQSNFSGFLTFVADFWDQTSLAIGEVTFDIESCRVIRDGS